MIDDSKEREDRLRERQREREEYDKRGNSYLYHKRAHDVARG